MNEPVYEFEETEEQPEVDFNPLSAAQALVQAAPDARESLFAEYKRLVALMVPKDSASVARCAVLVESLKKAAKYIEDKRKALLEPHETEVKRINLEHNPPKEFLLLIAKSKTEEVNKFLEAQRVAAELEQQRLLAEAAKRQALLDQQAREAREKAEAAAQNGHEAQAAVLEGKAMILEQKAAEVVPMQVAVPSRKVALDTSTVSFGGAKKVWALPGWNKESKLYADSAILDGVDMNWLRRFCVVDTVRLNAAFKSGEVFPKPFVVTNDYSKSTVRG